MCGQCFLLDDLPKCLHLLLPNAPPALPFPLAFLQVVSKIPLFFAVLGVDLPCSMLLKTRLNLKSFVSSGIHVQLLHSKLGTIRSSLCSAKFTQRNCCGGTSHPSLTLNNVLTVALSFS